MEFSAEILTKDGEIKMGGGTWKLSDTIIVSQSGDGDYIAITAALAAASSGDLVLVDEGTYTEDVIIGAGITLAGIDRDTVIIQSSSAVYTIVMSGAIARLADITVLNTTASGTPATVHIVTGGGCILRNVKGVQSGATTTGYGIFCQATATLVDCEFDAQNATTKKSLYGTAVVRIYGGVYHEDVEDASGVYLYGMPQCKDVEVVTAYGHWQDVNGKQRAMSPIDFDGVATAIIFDADGDSDLSSPADDVVELSLSTTKYRFTPTALTSLASAVDPDLGSTTAAEMWGNIYQNSSKDTYSLANEVGLAKRLHHWTDWDEHFDNISALPAGWGWAGAPFVTPTAEIVFTESYVRLGHAAATRSFLYKAHDGSTDTALYQAMMVTNSTHATSYAGLRLDDGSDNNYVEALIKMAASNSFTIDVAHNTGGAGRTVVTGSTFYHPEDAISLWCSGTRWSNWDIFSVIKGYNTAGLWTLRPSSAAIGVGWTPARQGFIVNWQGASWHRWYLDAYDGD